MGHVHRKLCFVILAMVRTFNDWRFRYDGKGEHVEGLSRVLFALAASGAVLSPSAVQVIANNAPECISRYASCARDMVTAMCLAQHASERPTENYSDNKRK